jgi:importin-9
MCVVWKIYKSRMPSIVQSLVLIFARLIQTNPKEIVEFLSETSIDNRICLKIVLDKWLLQQALFRGSYTKKVTLSALMMLFKARDPRIETLMVVGYNPSHSNINSDVNAPFKMLSLFMRFLENESKPTNMRGAIAPPVDLDSDGEEE